MRQLFSLSLLFLLMAIALPAYADIARPNPAPSPQQPKFVLHTNLTIVPDRKASEARLQISQSSLQELRAALADTSTSQSMPPSVAGSSTRTMLAGVFMFLSLSFAGVWLARSVQTRGQRALTLLLLGAAVISTAAIIAEANAGPPGSYFWRRLPQNLAKGTATNGGIDIEIVPEGSGIKLIMPMRPE